MNTKPPPFWIPQFSEPELWRARAKEDQIATILTRFPDAVVEEIAARLPSFVDQNRRDALPHLLRHWALSRLLGKPIFESTTTAKETRERVRKLRRSMSKALDDFRALGDPGLTLLSGGLNEPDRPKELLRIHEAYGLLRDFLPLAERVIAAADQVTDHKLSPGARRKDVLAADIRALAEIYAHVTGHEPTKTLDVVDDPSPGLFIEFAHACLTASDRELFSRAMGVIRRVLEERRKGEIEF